MSRSLFFIWLVVSLVWLAVVAVFAAQTWPHLPLDVSHTDPATRAALDRAVLGHVLQHALMAIGPPLVIGALARYISR